MPADWVQGEGEAASQRQRAMAADDSPCLAALVGKAGAASDCWSLERSGAGWGGEASLPEQAGAAAQEEQLPLASLWSQVGEGQQPHRLS